MGCNGIVAVGGGTYTIGGMIGYDGIVAVGGLGGFIPVCGEVEGGTWGSKVLGNISNGVGSLALFDLSLFNRCCKWSKSVFWSFVADKFSRLFRFRSESIATES